MKYSFYHKTKFETFHHDNREALLYLVQDFYEKNNIIFNREEIGRAIDRQSKMKTTPKKRPTLGEAVHGVAALLKMGSGKSVSNEEILRRSAICAGCPLRDKIGGCFTCGAAGKITRWANQVRANKGTQIPLPDSIKSSYCGICDCALALMVLTKHQEYATESPEKNARRPDICWLKTTSTNFTHE